MLGDLHPVGPPSKPRGRLSVRHYFKLKLEATIDTGHFVKFPGRQVHNEAPIFVEAYKMACIDELCY